MVNLLSDDPGSASELTDKVRAQQATTAASRLLRFTQSPKSQAAPCHHSRSKPRCQGSATSVFATLAAPSKLWGVWQQAKYQENLLHFSMMLAHTCFQPVCTNFFSAAQVAGCSHCFQWHRGANGSRIPSVKLKCGQRVPLTRYVHVYDRFHHWM